MNDQERSELELLKLRHVRLGQELTMLGKQLALLETRLTSTPANLEQPEAQCQPAAAAAPVAPAEVFPARALPARPEPAAPGAAIPPVIARTTTSTVPTPAVQPVRATASPSPSPASVPVLERTIAPSPTPILAKETPAQPAFAAEEQRKGSLEMRLGTYWLVRIGVVMVLTGLVFFGNLAYHNFISKMGPGGKVSLLYLAGFGLLGAGAWWQRKAATPALKNYAQVLFAGGSAAVYFTTYAAHHLSTLRVIQSAFWDGLLLLFWAGFIVFIADRKKSQILALFAIGLAYYSSIITRVGTFTLWSNLILTLTAVIFVVRNRWATLSFASLAATYVSYAFWRFFDGSGWHWATPEQGLWMGTSFLMMYWALFTATVFLSRSGQFKPENRAAFLTMNNGAFFSLFLLTMLQVREGGFWRFCLIYGSVLLAMAATARRVLAIEPLASHFYLSQGLLLVTLGFISKFTGLQLALVLAAESVVLLMLGHLRENLILRVGSYLTALLATGWAMDGLQPNDRSGLLLGLALGALMIVNAVLSHRKTASSAENAVRPAPAFFTVLALAIWAAAAWQNSPRDLFPLVLAGAALALTASIYLLQVPEIPVLVQSYVVAALGLWFVRELETPRTTPWWHAAILLVTVLALGHWWQRQKAMTFDQQARLGWQLLLSLALVGILHLWLKPLVSPPAWLAVTGGLAIGLTVYGALTRAWLLAACGQLFLVSSAVAFATQLASIPAPPWPWALAPIAALSLLCYAAIRWFAGRPDATGRIARPVLGLAQCYRWTALLMSIGWVCVYIPERERSWVLALLALAVFAVSGWLLNREALLFSAAFAASSLVWFALPLADGAPVHWPSLLIVGVLLGQQRIARRRPDVFELPTPVHNALIIIGCLALWLFVARWVSESGATASWSVLALALFGCGIAVRERMYRWVGLAVLACALARVTLIDVWKLEMVFRVLSFMAIGTVLLVLGFIYNKYQEKIRQWL
jgi:uncharacterized membrane protein